MKTFEKLEVWREGKVLAVEVYRSFRACRDFSFRDQIHRAALSVPANIAEGVERNSAAEFKNFLGVAKGSAGELRTFLSIAGELDYLPKDQEGKLVESCIRLSKRIHALILSLENRYALKEKLFDSILKTQDHLNLNLNLNAELWVCRGKLGE